MCTPNFWRLTKYVSLLRLERYWHFARTGSCKYAVPGSVLSLVLRTWHSYILHVIPTCGILAARSGFRSQVCCCTNRQPHHVIHFSSLCYRGAEGMFLCLALTVQDFFCIPRPNAPPLKRITLGSHHLEYGFPSTHSANAAGMAVFLYHSLLRWKAFISISGSPDQWSVLDDIVMNTYVMESMISIYAFTIIYGRVYSGMHTVLDMYTGC